MIINVDHIISKTRDLLFYSIEYCAILLWQVADHFDVSKNKKCFFRRNKMGQRQLKLKYNKRLVKHLKSPPRRLRKRKYEEAFRNATSEVHGDIKSVKVTLELRNTLSFYPRQDEKKIFMCLKIIYQTPEGPQTHPESNLNKR